MVALNKIGLNSLQIFLGIDGIGVRINLHHNEYAIFVFDQSGTGIII
jgi:hypothetical protein